MSISQFPTQAIKPGGTVYNGYKRYSLIYQSYLLTVMVATLLKDAGPKLILAAHLNYRPKAGFKN